MNHIIASYDRYVAGHTQQFDGMRGCLSSAAGCDAPWDTCLGQVTQQLLRAGQRAYLFDATHVSFYVKLL
jgi:hypothetical protein